MSNSKKIPTIPVEKFLPYVEAFLARAAADYRSGIGPRCTPTRLGKLAKSDSAAVFAYRSGREARTKAVRQFSTVIEQIIPGFTLAWAQANGVVIGRDEFNQDEG